MSYLSEAQKQKFEERLNRIPVPVLAAAIAWERHENKICGLDEFLRKNHGISEDDYKVSLCDAGTCGLDVSIALKRYGCDAAQILLDARKNAVAQAARPAATSPSPV